MSHFQRTFRWRPVAGRAREAAVSRAGVTQQELEDDGFADEADLGNVSELVRV